METNKMAEQLEWTWMLNLNEFSLFFVKNFESKKQERWKKENYYKFTIKKNYCKFTTKQLLLQIYRKKNYYKEKKNKNTKVLKANN